MQRPAIQGVRCAKLHDTAQIHDGNVIGNVFDHGQIVRNKQIGQPHLPLQTDKQIYYLCLNGNIQSGNRFIAYNELRFQSQSPGNADTLSLSS